MSRKACPRAECVFQELGTCLEGHPPEKCPFLNRPGTEPVTEAAEAEDERPVTVGAVGENMLTVAASRELLPLDADRIRRSTGATLVAFVGAHKSGKTTIITEFYEMLRRADLGSLSFAGSDTISGFEYRAHLSRMGSGGEDGGTSRTSASLGLHFLHLELMRDGAAGRRFHLLMSDRAGELVDDALNEPGEFAGLDEIRHADHVALVVDGSQLADPGRSGRHRHQTMSIVQAIRDAGLLGPTHRLQVLMAKLDLAEDAGNCAGAITAFDAMVIAIRRVLERTGSQVSGHLVSARSGNPAYKRGHGLQGLLDTWSATEPPRPLLPFAVQISSTDAFDRLLLSRRRVG